MYITVVTQRFLNRRNLTVITLIYCQFLLSAGVNNKVGWAFGLGLDRLVMTQYAIPDIRLLWSEDERFLDQFAFDNPDTPVTFKVTSSDCFVCLLLSSILSCTRQIWLYWLKMHDSTLFQLCALWIQTSVLGGKKSRKLVWRVLIFILHD